MAADLWSDVYPYGFLRLERFAQHPVRQYRVCHDGEEDLLRQLQKVILLEAVALDVCAAEAFASMLELAPVVLLGDERDVVNKEEV